MYYLFIIIKKDIYNIKINIYKKLIFIRIKFLYKKFLREIVSTLYDLVNQLILTFLIIVLIPVQNLSVATITINIFSNNVRPRILLIFQRTWQSKSESNWSTAERTYDRDNSSLIHCSYRDYTGWCYVNQCSTLIIFKI